MHMGNTIRVLDKHFVPFIDAATIHQKVSELALQLAKNYQEKKPLFLCILNGAFMFASDVFKALPTEAEICFIKLASYKGTKSTGNVITSIGLDVSLTNRHVIILEDVIDTGKTLHSFLPQIHNQHPASLEIAVLLHKPEATAYPVMVNYCCFSIPNKFVVGYGLDYDGFGRNLSAIYQLAE